MRLNTKSTKTQLLVLILVVVCGCAQTKPKHLWTDEALAAEALHGRGELEAADDEYERLLESAPDQNRARWLRHNRAELALEQGRTGDAIEEFRELRDDGTIDLWGANSAWKLAELEADPDQKQEALWQIVTRYPDEVAAERAIEVLERDARDKNSLKSFIEPASAAVDEVEGTMIADFLMFRLALAHEDAGSDADALSTFADLFRAYPDDSLADDALWEMARIHRKRQSWEPAIRLLEKIATDVEASWFVGSYASEWVDDSILLLAEIHLLFLEDHVEAIRWYDYYVDQYPDGFKADDAAWGAVEARRVGGDEAGHFSAMRAFLDEYPTSKWARVARARLGVRSDDDSR